MTLPDNFSVIINVCVIVLMLLSMIIGYIKGFLWQVLRVIGLIACFIISWVLAPGLSELVHIFPEKWSPFANTGLKDLFYNKLNSLVWFVIIFIVCNILLFLVKEVFNIITEIPVIKGANKILGALTALIPVFIELVVATYVLNSAIFTNGTKMVENSFLKYTNVIVDKATIVMSNVFAENVAIQKMLNDPKSITEEDLKSIIKWMDNNSISTSDIESFLIKYGIDPKKVNELINNSEK